MLDPAYLQAYAQQMQAQQMQQQMQVAQLQSQQMAYAQQMQYTAFSEQQQQQQLEAAQLQAAQLEAAQLEAAQAAAQAAAAAAFTSAAGGDPSAGAAGSFDGSFISFDGMSGPVSWPQTSPELFPGPQVAMGMFVGMEAQQQQPEGLTASEMNAQFLQIDGEAPTPVFAKGAPKVPPASLAVASAGISSMLVPGQMSTQPGFANVAWTVPGAFAEHAAAAGTWPSLVPQVFAPVPTQQTPAVKQAGVPAMSASAMLERQRLQRLQKQQQQQDQLQQQVPAAVPEAVPAVVPAAVPAAVPAPVPAVVPAVVYAPVPKPALPVNWRPSWLTEDEDFTLAADGSETAQPAKASESSPVSGTEAAATMQQSPMSGQQSPMSGPSVVSPIAFGIRPNTGPVPKVASKTQFAPIPKVTSQGTQPSSLSATLMAGMSKQPLAVSPRPSMPAFAGGSSASSSSLPAAFGQARPQVPPQVPLAKGGWLIPKADPKQPKAPPPPHLMGALVNSAAAAAESTPTADSQEHQEETRPLAGLLSMSEDFIVQVTSASKGAPEKPPSSIRPVTPPRQSPQRGFGPPPQDQSRFNEPPQQGFGPPQGGKGGYNEPPRGPPQGGGKGGFNEPPRRRSRSRGHRSRSRSRRRPGGAQRPSSPRRRDRDPRDPRDRERDRDPRDRGRDPRDRDRDPRERERERRYDHRPGSPGRPGRPRSRSRGRRPMGGSGSGRPRSPVRGGGGGGGGPPRGRPAQPIERVVSVDQVQFSAPLSKVGDTFENGRPLQELIDKLVSGEVDPLREPFLRLRAIERRGELNCLDNHRLKCLKEYQKQATQKVEIRVIVQARHDDNDMHNFLEHYSSGNQGDTVVQRRNREMGRSGDGHKGRPSDGGKGGGGHGGKGGKGKHRQDQPRPPPPPPPPPGPGPVAPGLVSPGLVRFDVFSGKPLGEDAKGKGKGNGKGKGEGEHGELPQQGQDGFEGANEDGAFQEDDFFENDDAWQGEEGFDGEGGWGEGQEEEHAYNEDQEAQFGDEGYDEYDPEKPPPE